VEFVEICENLETKQSGKRLSASHASAGEKERCQGEEIHRAKHKNQALFK
jgi:hypothetical protein